MSYERDFLIESVLGVLGRHEPQEATELQEPFDESLWHSLHDHGFTLVGIAEEAGGAGGELADAIAVARCSGRMAAAVPLAIVSSSSRPGVRRWTCGSTKAGARTSPAPSITRCPSLVGVGSVGSVISRLR